MTALPASIHRDVSHITYHESVLQGSDEWFELRRGILTASEVKLILTPTLKIANNDKTRAHLYELLAQRISGFVEPSYIGDDMLRGYEEEALARQHYEARYSKVREMGFVTNKRWGFVLGCSPDGLVGDDGMIEVKSRRQKFQVQTIIEDAMPADYLLQVQTALLVTERQWCDFISYSGGHYMLVKRVLPDAAVRAAIVDAAAAFYDEMAAKERQYHLAVKGAGDRLTPTKRTVIQDINV